MLDAMFVACSELCLQNIWRHICRIFEDAFRPYLETCLNYTWRHVYIMFEYMFTLYKQHMHIFTSGFGHVWKQLYTFLEYFKVKIKNLNIFLQAMQGIQNFGT